MAVKNVRKSDRNSGSYISYCPTIILSHDLTIGEAGYEKCDPLHFWGPGMRNFYTFHFVLSGFGNLTMNGEKYRIGAGDFFMMGPDDCVYYEADEAQPWEYRWISFNGASAKVLASAITVNSKTPVARLGLDSEAGKECDKLLENIYRGALGSDFPHLSALGNLYLFVEWLMKRFSRPVAAGSDGGKEYFYSAVNYINYHLSESPSIDELARYIGYDRTYIFKLFKKYAGVSPTAYIERFKIYRACMLIDENKFSLHEVAYRSGFSNYCWFCKVFKRAAGITPGGYAATDKKAEVLNCYNLTLPRDIMAEFERYSNRQIYET